MSRFLVTDANGGLEFSEGLVRTASGQFDINLIQTLTLTSLSLRSVDSAVTSQMIMLTSLDISKNNLTSLDGLAPLARTLVRLDASCNNISTPAPLYAGSGETLTPRGNPSVFGRLEVLRLQGNAIRKMEDVLPLAGLPKLRAIYLRDPNLKMANPVCDAVDDYAKIMAREFTPRCRCIDSHYFCHADVKPQRLQDADDNEMTLPISQSWVTEAFFSAAVTENAGQKFGAKSEAEVKKLLHETRAVLDQKINVQ